MKPQALLAQLVEERLLEVETETQVLQSQTVPPREVAEESRPPAAPAEKQRPPKPRDWQAEAYAFAQENEELLEDPDIDSITLSRLAKNSSDRLLELSREINKSAAREGFPAVRLRRMNKGYDKLKEFTERALALYQERFGEEGPELEKLERLWHEAESNVDS